MHLKELSERIQQLVAQSNDVLSSQYKESGNFSPIFVDPIKFTSLRASVLSFIAMVYGVKIIPIILSLIKLQAVIGNLMLRRDMEYSLPFKMR